MGFLSVPLTIAGTAMSAAATRQQGDLAMQTARRNAEVARNQTEQDRLTTIESMRRRRIENDRALSSIRNRLQGRGIVSTEGSTSDYLRDATSRLELQVLDEERAFQNRALARENQAQSDLYQGRVARSNSRSAATAHLIQGGVRVAGQLQDIRQQSPQGQFTRNAFGIPWF